MSLATSDSDRENVDDSASGNGLVCFTNCLLVQEDGSLVEKDLWIDERRGVVLDSQRTFFLRRERPDTVIDLGGNILSPGLLDIQINGAYNFDFSVYDGDDEQYHAGMDMIARRIVETGVTAYTQEKSFYPHLLELLRPRTPPPTPEYPRGGATLLGWHAEGPFLQGVKRGAHAQSFLQSAPNGLPDIESVYGAAHLAVHEDWAMHNATAGIRMLTLAPEVDGVLPSIEALRARGVVVSIGHSVAGADTAARAVRRGARMVTHLFNAMPQLHHRDPGIIGLLGASPASLVAKGAASAAMTPVSGGVRQVHGAVSFSGAASPAPAIKGHAVSSEGAEALDEHDTPPHTPVFAASARAVDVGALKLEVDDSKPIDAERPFYGLIVDGVHSHPNSVRLAYTAHKDGCILVTDAMKILDPNMPDGVYDWRDERRVVKEGVRLYIEGTDTLAGSVVTLDTCVRNFARFTGCTLGEALKCATYNPAKCVFTFYVPYFFYTILDNPIHSSTYFMSNVLTMASLAQVPKHREQEGDAARRRRRGPRRARPRGRCVEESEKLRADSIVSLLCT
ncbi:Metallo-dependent hydrolase [Phellopilus nigrolimitatus]|nr:Metallo-dependent hydrolase [Phellopilus nigrolimitatus]